MLKEFSDHEKRNGRMYKDTFLYETTLPQEEKKNIEQVTKGVSIQPIVATDVITDNYNAEVFEKDGKYIYNFWETSDTKLDPIFIKVFRDTSRFGKRFVKELNCWSYVVKGFADNPFAASLKMKVFEELDNDFAQHPKNSE